MNFKTVSKSKEKRLGEIVLSNSYAVIEAAPAFTPACDGRGNYPYIGDILMAVKMVSACLAPSIALGHVYNYALLEYRCQKLSCQNLRFFGKRVA